MAEHPEAQLKWIQLKWMMRNESVKGCIGECCTAEVTMKGVK